MNKEFIPYQQALALKELGFNEPCFGLYNQIKELCYPQLNYGEWLSFYNQKEDKWIVQAPTFSQAFRWFRENHDLNYVIVKAESWFYTINGCNTQEGFNTYEEAELACLNKLIEIVKL